MKKTFILNGVEPNSGAINFNELLDKPAGKHGFLQAKDGGLFFQDGTQLKIFGTSMVAGGCCPNHDVAEAVATRVASAGMNLVRMHYADSKRPGTLVNLSKKGSRELDPDALERLDYFINELNIHGVYVQLDTFVGRKFEPEGDNLDYPDEFTNAWATKHVNIYNRRLVELQKEYDRQLLCHVNQYKGIKYADDPGIAVVQVMNEDSLLWDFGSWVKEATNPPNYMKELRTKWTKWLKEKYKTQEAFLVAWTNAAGVCAVMDNDHINESVEVPTDLYYTSNPVGVPFDTHYNTLNSPPRHRDYAEFLINVEVAFCKEMYDYLKDEIGVKCCINTSCLARGSASVYTATQHCDLQEQNEYYNHPNYGIRQPPSYCHATPMYRRDPRERMSGHRTSNIITRLSWANVENKPLVVAEWNDVFPTQFTSECMYMLTAYGALNSWDGFCSFQYNNSYDDIKVLQRDNMQGYFDVSHNPSIFGINGVCSAAFQLGYIKPSKNTIDIVFTDEDIMASNPHTFPDPFKILPFISRVQSVFYNGKYTGKADIAITGGFTPTSDLTEARHAFVYSESPYTDAFQKMEGLQGFLQKHKEEDNKAFKDMGVIGVRRAVVEDSAKLFNGIESYGEAINEAMKEWGLWDKGQGIVDNVLISDSDEIRFDLNNKIFTVNTDKFKVYAGDVVKPFSLGRMEFSINNKNMSVSLFPKDGNPLEISDHILITAVGECCNTDLKRDGDWVLDLGHGPVWIDQIEGCVNIASVDEKTKIYALKPSGEREEELKSRFENGFGIFDFTTLEGAIHFEMVRG